MVVRLLEFASLVGTLLFAASGAMLGVKKRFDLLGVIVLGCVTAVGGGSLRDSLTGTTPPVWFKNELYLWAAIVGSVLGFVAYRRMSRYAQTLEWLDAAGLALFAATGAQRGLDLSFGLLGVVFVGTLSGVGGGVIRDVLAREYPRIFLPGELYASTAALGCAVLFFLHNHVSEELALAVVVIVIFVARILALRYSLRLPSRDPEKPLISRD